MIRRLPVLTVSALALMTGHGALAQEVIELQEITAFANLTTTSLNRTGATVEVITEEDLRREEPVRLSDFLARQPGISVSGNGPVGTTSNVRIRGLAGPYIAVRIDGIDVTDPSATQVFFDFATLTTADVSRVEIVKGSQSALAGSSAIGGVINITSRRAAGPGTSGEAQVEGGSFGTGRASVSLSNATDRGEATLSFSTIRTDGFSAADENNGNTEADAFEATRLSFFGDYAVSDSLTLGLAGFWEDSTTEFDNFESVPPFLPDDGPFLTENTDAQTRGLRAFAEFEAGAVQNTVALSYFDNERFTDFGGGTSEFRGERMKAEYLGTTTIFGDTVLSFGAEAADERFSTGVGGASGDRQIGALFAEALVPVTPAFDLAASIRVDSYSDFGEFVSGRLAGAYRIGDGTILRGIVSNGFRAPSLFEINDPTFGNAGLVEEESLNVEFGLEQSFANGGVVRATLFRTEIENLIDFDFLAGGYIQTTGRTETTGIELSGALPFGDRAEVFGNFTYADATGADGEQLRRVPETDLTLGIEGDITDRLRALGTVQFVGNVVDGEPLDDYMVANALLSYALTDRADAYLRIENIFDEQYQTTRGYGTSDRAFYVGLRTRF